MGTPRDYGTKENPTTRAGLPNDRAVGNDPSQTHSVPLYVSDSDDFGQITRPASPSEVVAAARQLEGAQVGWIGDTNVDELFDYVPDQHADVIDVSKMDRVLVIPLGIEGGEEGGPATQGPSR